MLNKRKIYVILLLLLIIFVSLSFYYILNFCHFGEKCNNLPIFFSNEIKEGLCLPSCSKAKLDLTKDSPPDCVPLNIKFLQPNDASKIEGKHIQPFIEKINKEMVNKYNYDIIKTLYTNYKYNVNIKCLTSNVQQGQSRGQVYGQNQEFLEKQKQEEEQNIMNRYFTDFSYNVTYQDVMDNLVIKLEGIKNNCIFRNHPQKDKIVSSIQQYKEDRSTVFSKIYEDLLIEIEPYGENILIDDECANDENQHFYKDENFKQFIKDQKDNKMYYSERSSFHKIYNYLQEAKQGKLGNV